MKLEWQEKGEFALKDFRKFMDEILFTREPYRSDHKIQKDEFFCLVSGGESTPGGLRSVRSRRSCVDGALEGFIRGGAGEGDTFHNVEISVTPRNYKEYGMKPFYEFFGTYATALAGLLPLRGTFALLVPHIHQYGRTMHIHLVYNDGIHGSMGLKKARIIVAVDPVIAGGRKAMDFDFDAGLLSEEDYEKFTNQEY